MKCLTSLSFPFPWLLLLGVAASVSVEATARADESSDGADAPPAEGPEPATRAGVTPPAEPPTPTPSAQTTPAPNDRAAPPSTPPPLRVFRSGSGVPQRLAPASTTTPPPPDTKPAESASVAETEAETEASIVRPQGLSLYGFSDFGFNKFYTSDKSQLNALFPSKAGTFVLGNANVFFDAEPYEGWRNLIEVRFTNLPNGYEQSLGSSFGTTYTRNNTTIGDFTSPSIRGSVTLGSIIVERAQTEYAVSDALHVMAGYFFTPWGIWNVDHGTPTLISLLMPSFMADDYLPSRQLGVQVYGSAYTPHWEFGYHAYVGNNRTPSQVDFSDGKSFGGRLFASSTGTAVKAKFGVSGYYGHGYDITKDIVAVNPYQVQTTQTVAYREWMVGADASLDAGPLRLRLEGLVKRIDYEAGKNPGNDSADGTYYTDGYVILAYRLPFWGLEPYVYGEAIHWKSDLGDTALIPSVGLNIHFNPAVQLKAQYGRAMFMDLSSHPGRSPSDNDVNNLAARLVVSF